MRTARDLAFCEQWRWWLLLAGKRSAWREFREKCWDCGSDSLGLPANAIPLLLMVKQPDLRFYHTAFAAPVELAEHEGEERIRRSELSATGAFHQSVLLALEWANRAYGPPPTGLTLCVDAHALPAPWNDLAVLDDESAGLAILIAAAWHLRGVRPSKPVAFTGRLEEKSEFVRQIDAVEDKAAAARRAGVAWTFTPTLGPKSARASGLLELGEDKWTAWLDEAEKILAERGVALEPDFKVWETWLAHVERLRQARRLNAIDKAVKALSERARMLASTDGRWGDIQFRLEWEEATLALHRGASSTGARDLSNLKRRLDERTPTAPLYSQRAVRLSAGLLHSAIDRGAPTPPLGVERHLRGAAASPFSDNASRLYALGSLAEWALYQHGWRRRPGRGSLARAEHLLGQKHALEEAAARMSGDKLLRSNGQRATLLSLAGRWPEVPGVLAGLLEVDTRNRSRLSAADRTNWRYQAFYAARWLAHCRLADEPIPTQWQVWWRSTLSTLKRDLEDNGEPQLLLGFERSSLILDGPECWAPSRQRRLETVLERVQHDAEEREYEQDFLVSWGFAGALAWLGRRWRTQWTDSWATRRSACLDRLRWHGRYNQLRRLDRWLDRQAPASDRQATGLQAILGVVLY